MASLGCVLANANSVLRVLERRARHYLHTTSLKMSVHLEGRVLHRKRHLFSHKWQLLKLVISTDASIEWKDDLKKVEIVGRGVLSDSQPSVCGANLNDNVDLLTKAKYKPEHSLGDRFGLFVQDDDGDYSYEFFLAQGDVSATDWVAAAQAVTSQSAAETTAIPATFDVMKDENGMPLPVDPEDVLSKLYSQEAADGDIRTTVDQAIAQELHHAEKWQPEEDDDGTMLADVLSQLEDIKPELDKLGYQLAKWGYLGLWIGTSNSFSIAFEPIPKQPQTDLNPDKLPASASTGFQRALYAGLVRAQDFVSTLQAETMKPVRVTASIAGLGLNIPSVTVAVTLADGVDAGKVVQKDHEQASAEEARSKGLWGKISDTAGSIVQVLRHPFTSLGQPVLRTIVREIQDLRDALAGTGLKLGTISGHGGWLSLKVGTFMGLSFSLVVLDDVDKQEFHPENLSTFQRLLLGMVARSHRLAVKATAESLEPVMYTVSLSGLGLAIPSATVTVLMQTVTEPGKAIARTTQVLKNLEASVDDDIKQAAEAAVESPEQGETSFVEDVWGQLKDKTTNGAERIAQATRAAVLATGQAAATVIGAVTGALGQALGAATTLAVSPITSFMLDHEAVKRRIKDLPIELYPQPLSLTYGTQFGVSLAFMESPGASITELPAAVASSSKDDDADDDGFAERLATATNAVIHASAAASALRKQTAQVNQVVFSVSGLGLGVPVVAGGIYLGRS
eukprot:m.158895 g.158895  ORF g.158895 m.158895 type:complete len:736 (+) comp16477_c1_seq1:1524-3731(+)